MLERSAVLRLHCQQNIAGNMPCQSSQKALADCQVVCAGKLHPELMEAAALHSRTMMTSFQPQSIANMIWAYATLAHTPPSDFLTLLCNHALHELPNFSPQNISNTIWALATLKHTNRVMPMSVYEHVSF